MMEIFLNLCKVNLLCYQILSKIIFQWGFFSRAWLPLSSDGLYWGFCPIPAVGIHCAFSGMVFLCGSEYCVSKVP